MDAKIKQGTVTQDRQYLHMVDAVAEELQQASEPLSIDELSAFLTATFEIASDLVQATIKQILVDLYQAVEVQDGRYGWLMNLLDDSNIRHPLTSEEATSGFLLLDELEHAVFFPEFFQTHQPDERILHIQLFGGPRIPAEAYIQNKTWALRLGDQFTAWVDMQGGQGRDDIIIMVNNARAGEYTLRLLPREIRDDNTIQGRNVQLSLLAEDIVRRTCPPNTAMQTWDIAATVLATSLFDEATPPDDMHCVLHQYSMLRFNGKVGYVFDPDDTNSSQAGSAKGKFPPFGFSDASDELSTKKSQSWSTANNDETVECSVDLDMLDTHNDADYDYYVEKLHQIGLVDAPLTQNDFILLKAELKALIYIERDCGRLLEEQRSRRHELISYLLIRPETLLDDSDAADQQDYDDLSR